MAKFNAEKFLEKYDQYISLVQGDAHGRRSRVAMFWSIVSILYIIGFVKVSKTASIWLISIPDADKKAFGFLFCVTAYYIIRFGFSVVKVYGVENPRTLQKELRQYKQIEKIGFDDKDFAKEHSEYATVYHWRNRINLMGGAATTHGPRGALQIKNQEELRNHNLSRPNLGFLENFFALLYLPMTVCALASLALFGVVLWNVFSPDTVLDILEKIAGLFS